MTPQFLCLALLVGQTPNDPTTLINAELSARWQLEKLTPAEQSRDLEFLRRASLDLIGRIPTLAEQDAFMKDDAKQRRRLLIDRLLAHDDHARHWADNWSDWLLGTGADAKVWQPFHDWLQQHIARGGSHKQLAEKLLVATGSTRDNPAVHLYVQQRGQQLRKQDWENWGQYDMVPFTGQMFRVFHARRLQCVQCHDHPWDDDLRQQDFHQMNLFFRQVRFTQKGGVVEISDDPALNKSGLGYHERRNGVINFTAPRFYQGGTWKPGMKLTRREFFAERFVKHPDFARGHVNLLWAYFFGHGLTHSPAFDDMTGADEVVHKKIMAGLSDAFVTSGHDSKALMRWICNSDAYALKSVANKSNASAEQAVYVSRMPARPLSGRQLTESVIVALTGEDYVKRRDKLRAELLADLPPRSAPMVSECETPPLELHGGISVQQALWLMNGSVIQRELAAPDGPIGRAVKKHGASADGLRKALPEFYAIMLCRPPTVQEVQRLTDPEFIGVRAKAPQQTAAFWRTYYEDIFWALLNTSEFGLNH